MKATCSYAQCGRAAHTKGLCASHYRQTLRNGGRLTPLRPPSGLVRGPTLRLTADELTRLQKVASKQDKSTYEWVRDTVRRALLIV